MTSDDFEASRLFRLFETYVECGIWLLLRDYHFISVYWILS